MPSGNAQGAAMAVTVALISTSHFVAG